MDINKEFDKLEMKNFIELTKEAIDQEIKHEKWDDLRKNYSINEVGVKYNTDILDKWNKIRTMYGLYTEGKKGTYMYRPRFPEGKVPLEKLELLSELGEKYGDKRIHVTTRQDIQLQGIKKENLPKVLQILFDNGYTSRAAGGNAARAVLVPAMSGFEEEIFDASPYATIITDFMLSSSDYMGLPRKYKIALSNNEKNSVYVKIADLGLLAIKKDNQLGFKIYGAGGLGAVSQESIVLCDFVKREEILYHVLAMKNLFAEHGDRTNKARARIRYILIKLEKENFLELYTKYLEEAYKNNKLEIELPAENIKKLEEASEIEISENILKSNVKGRYGYYIHPVKGDLFTKEALDLINTLKSIPYEIDIRTTASQGLVIRNLKGEDIEKIKVHDKTKNIKLFKSVACIGNSVCNLGVLDTPKLINDIFEHFSSKENLANFLPTLRISGCPNSCGTHQIGELGLWGKKKGGESYFTFVARGDFSSETVTLNKPIGELIQNKIPFFLEELAETLREENIQFNEFIKFENRFENLLEKYQN